MDYPLLNLRVDQPSPISFFYKTLISYNNQMNF